MKVDLDIVKQLIPLAAEEKPTGDQWLDNRYQEDVPIIGHTNPYYKLFFMIARTLEPKLTVELGSYRATAAAHFASGYLAGAVYTVDIHREDKVAQAKSIEAAGHYSNLEYINGWTWDSHVVFQIGSAAADTPIDLLYIDAWHRYDYAMMEWELYSPMLADEALVICDDIFNAPGATERMVEFWADLTSGRECFLSADLHPGIPMGFMRFLR